MNALIEIAIIVGLLWSVMGAMWFFADPVDGLFRQIEASRNPGEVANWWQPIGAVLAGGPIAWTVVLVCAVAVLFAWLRHEFDNAFNDDGKL